MSGYRRTLAEVVCPDYPADSEVHVIAHYGDMTFIEVTSVTGGQENWSIQLDPGLACILIDAIQRAADSMPDLR